MTFGRTLRGVDSLPLTWVTFIPYEACRLVIMGCVPGGQRCGCKDTGRFKGDFSRGSDEGSPVVISDDEVGMRPFLSWINPRLLHLLGKLP